MRWRWLSPAVALAFAGCAAVSGGIDRHRLRDTAADGGPRVLCVVAHPDDEIAFAATLFKTATHLDGVCDIVVITNGEGGYKYSTLGELFYGLELTDPAVGRAHLPAIRQREHLRGGEILGFHDVTYLNQLDHRYTKNVAEVLAPEAEIWDLDLVRDELRQQLARGDYDFVLTHIPSVETHGHHQAATILALETVAAMPEGRRPVVLGAHPSSRRKERPAPAKERDDYPIARLRSGVEPFTFDRAQKFGLKDRLDYQIVVNWAIAEHKSQGTFQTLMNRWDLENFYLYALDVPNAEERARAWFRRLAEPQFEKPEYDENGARLASGR